jgi:DNA-binding NtrC family response regulator
MLSDPALRMLAGDGAAMRGLRDEARAIAALDSTVLLTGETGTGKGRVARLIHDLSGRAASPFVHVDCAALSTTLIESELFGHEKGAFTSATHQHAGRFERAGQGTLFLDEIGDLEPRLQAKLLRVLEDREYERVGGMQTLKLRARVVAATSRDLRRAVQAGGFRADLYFRLSVFHLELPPLRERSEDIPALVEHGLERLAKRLSLPPPRPTGAFLARLMEHSWPGNVRELMNLLERFFARSAGRTLCRLDLEGALGEWEAVVVAEAPAAGGGQLTLPGLLAELSQREQREIADALRWSGGNVTGAARRLRIPRGTLRHKLQKYEIGAATPGVAAAVAPRPE